jgi:molecular chaperone DnaK (HSP70)
MWLGIDFGTSSFRATALEGETLHKVKNPHRLGYTFPSSAFVEKPRDGQPGKILVGDPAENLRLGDPDRYRREFKRDLGRKDPLLLGERRLLPEDLVAEVLRKLLAEAEQALQRPAVGAVLTVPAVYQKHKRRLMEEAGRAAGFEAVELLEEPAAAAVCYAAQGSDKRGLAAGEAVLVYDLGGGTFDAALLRKVVDGYRLLAPPVGLDRCGGVDFDNAVFEDLKRRCSPELRDQIDGQRGDVQALRTRLVLEEQCREIKHLLSEAEEFDQPLRVGTMERYRLTRQAFTAMIAPAVEQTLGPCRQLLKEAGLRWKEVAGILLVGGSCRIPYVREVLGREFGRPIFPVPDLELAVCQGAALHAARLLPRQRSGNRPPRPEATGLPEELRAKLPPLPARVLELQGELRTLDDSARALRERRDDILLIDRQALEQAEAEFHAAGEELSRSGQSIPQGVKDRLTGRVRSNPRVKLAELYSLAAGVPDEAARRYIDRLLHQEEARQTSEAARQRYEARRDREIGSLRRKAEPLEQELRALLEADFASIVDRFVEHVGDGKPLPPRLLNQWVPPLKEARGYPWEVRDLLAMAEEYLEARPDELAWRAAERAGAEPAYEAYLRSWPVGRHVADAKRRLDGFARERDERAWQDAENRGTEEAYQAYLADRPQGRHAAEAQGQLEAFAWQEAERVNTVEGSSGTSPPGPGAGTRPRPGRRSPGCGRSRTRPPGRRPSERAPRKPTRATSPRGSGAGTRRRLDPSSTTRPGRRPDRRTRPRRTSGTSPPGPRDGTPRRDG